MSEHEGKIWKSLEIMLVFIAASGMVMTLGFVFNTLRFHFGVDYHMAHAWFSAYRHTGVFFPENTVFYNFPLAVVAFGPSLFLPVSLAVALKFIQTLSLVLVSIGLLSSMRPGFFKSVNPVLYVFIVMMVSFVLAQLCYLNIYMEVATCLMAVLYFTEKNKERAAAFFLSLAVVFKVFLAPLVLVPLLTRKYRLFSWSLVFLAGCVGVSLALFGIETHVQMLKAMGEGYNRMRLHGIGYPYVADGFAGWQDVFNKLMVIGLLPKGLVSPMTLTMAGLYGCAFLWVCFQMAMQNKGADRESGFFVRVFASMILLSVGFNFRFDHGTLFLALLPWFATLKRRERRTLILAMFFLTLCRFPFERLLSVMGFDGPLMIVSRLFYVVSFQFIGINLLVYLLVNHWTVGNSGNGEQRDENHG